jgi:hypothetical protein
VRLLLPMGPPAPRWRAENAPGHPTAARRRIH